MHLAHRMSIIYRKGSVNEADVVSRRPDFFHPDDIRPRMSVEMFAFWWNGKYLICVIKVTILHC
jgi:hypothetical protein